MWITKAPVRAHFLSFLRVWVGMIGVFLIFMLNGAGLGLHLGSIAIKQFKTNCL
jgi:hypothetical protein